VQLHSNAAQAKMLDPKAMVRELAKYRQPDTGRSVLELLITLVPFAIFYFAAMALVSAGYWIGGLLVVPAGAMVLRLFLIQHDCGHDSFFRNRSYNDWLGRFLGVLTMTPYDCWRRSHALHHAGTGNLAARGFGDVDTLTVREYMALPAWRRMLYRVYRHPLVLFGFGPFYLFILRHRLPIGLMKDGARYWISAIATNLGIAAIAVAAILAFGLIPFLFVHLATILIAASAGVWLFYVQHQFEETHWADDADWSFHDSAILGSSHLALNGWMRWVTANIGVHHVHHLVSRIPFYRLPEVLRDRPELAEVNRLTLGSTFSTVRLALWDEDRRRLVTFKAARRAG
jgi:acyl-lipid omega-6 desaturase (Delta-12 desaturase)